MINILKDNCDYKTITVKMVVGSSGLGDHLSSSRAKKIEYEQLIAILAVDCKILSQYVWWIFGQAAESSAGVGGR